jgi:hypothetical protein
MLILIFTHLMLKLLQCFTTCALIPKPQISGLIHRVAASRPLDLFCVYDYTLISGYSAPLLHKNVKDMLFYVRACLCLYIQSYSLSNIASRLNSMGFAVNLL